MTLTDHATDGHVADRDRLLFERLRDRGDSAAEAMLVERFLPLARSVARSYANGPDTFDDVFQVACLGLVKAIGRFDPERRIAFSSYAVPTMAGEIKRYFRDRTWSVRPPREIQELALRVDKAIGVWTDRHGAAPTVSDLAGVLGEADEDVLEALHASRARNAVSLDLPVGHGHDPDPASLGEVIGNEDPGFDDVVSKAEVHELLGLLSARDREIVWLRFTLDMTQEEIGRIHGISQMQVSRILHASLERLRIVAAARARSESGGHGALDSG